LRLDQLDAHIAELANGKYHVLPLPEIVAAIGNRKPLPDRTIALTIDDAYLSVYTKAWPRLKKAGLPFTVFVATGPIDRGSKDMMTWDQLRELAASGVTIGGHSVTHLHMANVPIDVSAREIAESNARFEAEFGKRPTLFAYPYGEANIPVIDLVRESGAVAAFGQQSGVVNPTNNFFYLPRLALNEQYGDLGRFQMLANALPLPVSGITPADPTVTQPNPPAIGFSVASDVERLNDLACYLATEGRVAIKRLGKQRMEIRLKRPLGFGRTRLNCTVPTKDGRWRWFGWQYYVPPR
jgi:peptidoglycan/xylan/chitin deacetylase (PgdA/CDA1 family)